MARGFGATYGTSGTTDRIVTGLTGNSSGVRSWFIRFYRNGTGGGGFGRLWQKGDNDFVGSESLYVSGPDSKTYFWRYNASSVKTGAHSFGILPSGGWGTVLVVHDQTSGILTAPSIYVDGSLQSLAVVASSFGHASNTDPMVIGNRPYDNATAWDGLLADFAVWNGDVSAFVDALHAGYSPLEIRPDLLVEHVPMMRSAYGLAGATTVTGALVQQHPPIRRRRWSRFVPAVVAGGAASGSGSVTDAGVLAGTGLSARSGSGDVAGAGALAGTGYAVHSGSGAVSGAGTLAGTGEAPAVVATAEGSGSVAGAGTLAATGYAAHFGYGIVSGSGQFVGAGNTSALTGTIGRRRGRAPLWRRLDDMRPRIDPAALKQEREHIQALLDDADLWSLLDEQAVLREALDYATKAQTQTISAMLKQVERRVAEVEDDEAATIVLIL